MIGAERVRAPDDRGQGLVEFALTVPVVILLVVGTIDVARGLQAYVSVSNAAREGAREASIHGSAADVPWGPAANDGRVQVEVRSRVAGIPTEDIAVTSSWPAGNDRGDEVVVGASYTFRPIASALLGGVTLDFSTSSRARILR